MNTKKREAKTPKPTTGFAIVEPSGMIDPFSVRGQRDMATKDLADDRYMTWADMKKIGYRCIRVTIAPAQAKAKEGPEGLTTLCGEPLLGAKGCDCDGADAEKLAKHLRFVAELDGYTPRQAWGDEIAEVIERISKK